MDFRNQKINQEILMEFTPAVLNNVKRRSRIVRAVGYSVVGGSNCSTPATPDSSHSTAECCSDGGIKAYVD